MNNLPFKASESNYKMRDNDFNQLKVGDIVVCIINRPNYVAKYGEKYIIKQISGFGFTLKYLNNITLKPTLKYRVDNKDKYFFASNFVPEYMWISSNYGI
jgi:hypothetical protein